MRKICLIVWVVIILGVATSCNKSPKVIASNITTDKVILLGEDGEYTLYEGQENIVLENDDVYISLDIIGKVFPYYVKNEASMLLTTIDKTYIMKDKKIFVDGKSTDYDYIQKDGDYYLSLSFLDNVDIQYRMLNENVVVLKDIYSGIRFVELKDKSYEKEGSFIVLSEDNDGIEILDKEGVTDKINLYEGIEIRKNDKKEIEYKESIKNYRKKINLTFEGVYDKKIDTSEIGEMTGVNVISPTWYELKNGQGDIISRVDQDYIDFVKGRNLEIWALYSNGFDKDRTREMLQNIEAREKTIDYILQQCERYDLDGINLDFENVYEEDRALLVSYAWQLTNELHKKNIVVSMDVTVKGGSSSWSMCYDRGQLARVLDYIIVMTYDEHWAASPVSGSTSSYGWILKSLTEILEEIPKDKLIMGMPLYTRIWTETISRKEVNEMETSSQTLKMKTTEDLIKKNPEGVLIWDDEGKQYFFSYFHADGLRKIWIEDEKSIAYKTSIAYDLDLQGVATWKRGQEKETIWEVIERVLNGADPTEIEGTMYFNKVIVSNSIN